jgi:hypothetical protein
MPRRAAAPAADAPAAARCGSNTGSISANDAAAQELAERRKFARAAAAWAFENNVGSKAALKEEQFKDRGLTYNMVEPLLKELKAGGTKLRVDAARDHHCQVLTNNERVKLAEWILACVADPRRVLNSDETPQPIDAPQKGRRSKVAKAQGKEERAAAFARCEAACSCGVVPCPWASWKRCPTCGPKKGLCKVRVCVAARKPLLLGYNPAVGTAEAEGEQGELVGAAED